MLLSTNDFNYEFSVKFSTIYLSIDYQFNYALYYKLLIHAYIYITYQLSMICFVTLSSTTYQFFYRLSNNKN